MSDALPVKHDDTLKFIALTTMLIDHIGYLLFPQFFILRIIGRLSFPIFTYLIANGAKRTSNRTAYALRLLAVGIVSQIPYNLFSHNLWWSFTEPNIFFTLLAGLLMIYCLQSDDWVVKLLSVSVLFTVVPLNLSYSYYGLLLILVFFLFDNNPWMTAAGFGLASFQYYVQFSNYYQMYAIPVLAILFWMPRLGIHIPKWLGYAFYPVHLTILFGIYYIWF